MQTFPANITTVASFMPLPFILNTNSPEAFLFGDFYNGTQPDNAGIYNCVANGEIRATVEILVLGKALIALTQHTCINYRFPICRLTAPIIFVLFAAFLAPN